MTNPNRPSSTKLKINGVLLLDKDSGMSSNTALQRARRLFNAAKAGHTGVLDPLATGLLPVCFGEATKFSQYLLDADKGYETTLKLGEATATGDAEGEIVARGNSTVSHETLEAAVAAHTGSMEQMPPMFSALKHQGRPLYEYARKGIEIERKKRNITIHRIGIEEFAPPRLVLSVQCSKGTYIRTLAEDIAKHMNTVAHLTALRRTATAGFSIGNAYTLAQLEAMSAEQRNAVLLPCDVLVQHFPRITLSDEEIVRLQHGLHIHTAENYGIMPPLRVYGNGGRFIGLAQSVPSGLKALRLMSTAATA